LFSAVFGGIGTWTLYRFRNALRMWLTFETSVGYVIVHARLLKPATPQNIVIGGTSGAMPPALGWGTLTGRAR
jgi:protoheme IX farnesyltransferase